MPVSRSRKDRSDATLKGDLRVSSRPRLLIVEDEPAIVQVLQYNLEQAGYRVAVAKDGVEGVEQARKLKPQLIILDLMLPEMDGFSVCRELRGEGATAAIPILMLTAKGQEIDRITGLELGADDYLTKPFSPREVVARVKAILRRVNAGEPEGSGPTLKRGSIEINDAKHEVRIKGKVVELRKKEYELLKIFLGRPGQVFSREVLLERVWHYEQDVETRTVDVHIRRLREKLGPLKKSIATVAGVGYKFV